MRHFVTTCLLLICQYLLTVNVNAQNFQFGQYDFSLQRINPGIVATNNYSEATFLFRNQNTSSDFALKSTFFSLDYPLNRGKKGKKWGGLGLYFLNDKQGTGNSFHWNQIGLNYAFSFPLSATQSINFGISLAWNNQRFTFDEFFTESQFSGIQGFNPSLASGENFGTLANNYLSTGTGVYWQKTDKKGIDQAAIGFSIGEINRPDVSLMEDDVRLQSTFTLLGYFKAYENKNFSISPEFIVFHNAGGLKFNVGPNFLIPLDKYPVASIVDKPHMEIGIKYSSGNNLMGNIAFGSNDWAVGVNYESGNNNRLANTNTFEVALKYQREVKPKKLLKRTKKKKRRKNKNAKTKKRKVKKRVAKKRKRNKRLSNRRAFDRSRSIPTKSNQEKDVVVPMEKEPSLTQQEKIEKKVIKPIHNVAEDDKEFVDNTPKTSSWTVRFEFDTDKLTGESMLTLENIIKRLKTDTSQSVHLTGHTDSVGSLDYNQALSMRRANNVKKYMIDQGIHPNRVTIDGKGETKPISNNATLVGRLANRRVEIRLF